MSSSVFSRWTAQSLQKWQQGQEILEEYFFSSITNTENQRNFLHISALASEKGLNQKNKALYCI